MILIKYDLKEILMDGRKDILQFPTTLRVRRKHCRPVRRLIGSARCGLCMAARNAAGAYDEALSRCSGLAAGAMLGLTAVTLRGAVPMALPFLLQPMRDSSNRSRLEAAERPAEGCALSQGTSSLAHSTGNSVSARSAITARIANLCRRQPRMIYI